jgi:hypothetical protein
MIIVLEEKRIIAIPLLLNHTFFKWFELSLKMNMACKFKINNKSFHFGLLRVAKDHAGFMVKRIVHQDADIKL